MVTRMMWVEVRRRVLLAEHHIGIGSTMAIRFVPVPTRLFRVFRGNQRTGRDGICVINIVRIPECKKLFCYLQLVDVWNQALRSQLLTMDTKKQFLFES